MAKVLLVDDEPGIRAYLRVALERDGHEVAEAPSGEDGLAYLSRHQVHVLLTDLRMPGMGGLELIRRALELDSHLEVLVLTAHSSVDSAVEVMKAGAADYIRKPVKSPTSLRHVVQRAAERRQMRTQVEALAPVGGPTLTYGAPAMQPLVKELERVAATRATVLLTGESGTGKEVAARRIHDLSGRKGAFVAVNCAALSASLLESELFGHERGAFTGAVARRRGKIELAEGGTFFLDEVAELESGLQAKLLRVLQERAYERVGGQQTIQADVRWIAATNRDLTAMIAQGTYREDLYYRLAVFPLRVPSLHERRTDIPGLAQALLRSVGAELGRRLHLSASALELLAERDWPGNVRELRNVLERAAILTEGHEIGASDLGPQPQRFPSASSAVLSMEEAERAAIEAALDHVDGNRKQAAEVLGIGVRTLYDKLKRYELG